MEECDKHNAIIKERATRKAKKSMGGAVEKGVYDICKRISSAENIRMPYAPGQYEEIFNKSKK